MSDNLRAQNLCKNYKTRSIVHHFSICLSSGEIIGLLGPNGAGKTTAFYMLVGLIPVDEGQIWLNTQDITRLSLHGRAMIGLSYLPQEASIFRKLSVAENIMAALELQKKLNKPSRQIQLQRLLKEFHIQHIRNTLGMYLSGGERRRTEIARIIALQPKFILLDEPFSGIDPLSILDIKQIIQQLVQQGIGVLITDHNVRETLTLCQRAYIVNQGKIICEGTPSTILNHSEVRAVYLGEKFNL